MCSANALKQDCLCWCKGEFNSEFGMRNSELIVRVVWKSLFADFMLIYHISETFVLVVGTRRAVSVVAIKLYR